MWDTKKTLKCRIVYSNGVYDSFSLLRYLEKIDHSNRVIY